MFLIVVGAGRTGSRVIEMANAEGHEVVAIEHDREIATQASTQYDCIVVHDDAGSRDVLLEADVEDADALVATTDEDATNLLVMMHGRDLGVDALVSSVNEESNLSLYEQLGVRVVANPHRLTGESLYRSAARPSVREFMEVGDDAEIFEVEVSAGAPIAGRHLQEARKKGILGGDTIVVAVERGQDVLVPGGQTRLEVDDVVTVFSREGATEDTLNAFAAD